MKKFSRAIQTRGTNPCLRPYLQQHGQSTGAFLLKVVVEGVMRNMAVQNPTVASGMYRN
jgi:hypothetical protein